MARHPKRPRDLNQWAKRMTEIKLARYRPLACKAEPR